VVIGAIYRRPERSTYLEIDKIIADLKKERDRLARAITALVGVGSKATGGKRGRKRKPGPMAATMTGKRRGGISKEGRKRLSELMKRRWAEGKIGGGTVRHRRGGSLKKAKPPA
jgi:hypothetical protein